MSTSSAETAAFASDAQPEDSGLTMPEDPRAIKRGEVFIQLGCSGCSHLQVIRYERVPNATLLITGRDDVPFTVMRQNYKGTMAPNCEGPGGECNKAEKIDEMPEIMAKRLEEALELRRVDG